MSHISMYQYLKMNIHISLECCSYVDIFLFMYIGWSECLCCNIGDLQSVASGSDTIKHWDGRFLGYSRTYTFVLNSFSFQIPW